MLKSVREKGMFSRIIAAAVAVILAFSSFLCFQSKAADKTYEVGDYKGDRAEEDWGKPEEEGKIFAGWYVDANFQTPYLGTTGQAYAKFVNKDVLTVKKQLSRGTYNNSENTDVRFLTSIDSLAYKCVGFEVNVTNANGESVKNFNLMETTAYSSILENGNTTYPSAVFDAEQSKFFVLHSITGIPNASFGDTFTVNPYWVTLDGTKVYGTEHHFTVRGKINEELVEGEINNFDSEAKALGIKAANEKENIHNVNYVATKADQNGVTKQGVVEIHLEDASTRWPGVRFGAPLCEKPEAGKYKYVVFTMYVEDAPANLGLTYYMKEDNNDKPVKEFKLQQGWAEYWVPVEMFDYDELANGRQWFCFFNNDNENNITNKVYVDSIRYANRAEAEVTDTTAEFMNFNDGMAVTEFGTANGSNWCIWMNGYEGAKGVVKCKVQEIWPNIKGFKPMLDKQAYLDLGYGTGDYFVIKLYKANTDGGVEFYYSMTGSGADGVSMGILENGWNTLKIDAGIVLDHWDAFVNGTAFLMPTNNGDITHELYFDSMYFEKAVSE